MNKYHSKKVSVDGAVYDSKKEYRRHQELLLLERAGAIKDLKRQVKFVLIPSQRDAGGKLLEREVSYKADFAYTEGGNLVVEDTKGFRTKEYIIKRKLMLWVHGIRIFEN